MRPHVSGTECVGFSKARRSWESGSSITTVDCSLFCLLRKASAVNVRWTEHYSYLSFSQKSSSWHFLALAKLCSIAQVWNHQKNFQLMNKGWLSLVRWQLSRSCFTQAIVRTFLDTMLCSGIFNLRKIVLLWYRFCWIGAWSSPFKVLLLLRKLVRFRNFFCTLLPHRPSLVGADTSTKTGCFQTQILVNKKKEFLV